MLSLPTYRRQWERKRQWYEKNGYLGQIITSEDGPDGRIDAAVIERTAREDSPGRIGVSPISKTFAMAKRVPMPSSWKTRRS